MQRWTLKQIGPNVFEICFWDVSAIANQLGAEIIDEIPLCSGGDGAMVLKTGTKEGKEYRGWVCPIKTLLPTFLARFRAVKPALGLEFPSSPCPSNQPFSNSKNDLWKVMPKLSKSMNLAYCNSGRLIKPGTFKSVLYNRSV